MACLVQTLHFFVCHVPALHRGLTSKARRRLAEAGASEIIGSVTFWFANTIWSACLSASCSMAFSDLHMHSSSELRAAVHVSACHTSCTADGISSVQYLPHVPQLQHPSSLKDGCVAAQGAVKAVSSGA